jgi:hypothetical protein
MDDGKRKTRVGVGATHHYSGKGVILANKKAIRSLGEIGWLALV